MRSRRIHPGIKPCKKCSITKSTLKRVRTSLNSKGVTDIQTIRYIEPSKKDMAVGLVYFNSTGSKRLLMNYLYTVEKLKLANIPYYTIEMYTDKPDIADAVHVKTDFVIFQKERLCYVLEKHIPKKYTKLLFMDSDIIYEDPNWYTEISCNLNKFNIVQGYSNIVYLDLTYRERTLSLLSYNMKKVFPKIEKTTPGGVWGFQRDWFNKVGFFQYDPVGANDSYSLQGWTGGAYKPDRPIPKYLVTAYNEFTQKIISLPSICYVPGTIYHLWHGSLKNRQYGKSRIQMFESVDNIKDVMKIGKNDIFEMMDNNLRKKIRDYFIRKDDDGIL